MKILAIALALVMLNSVAMAAEVRPDAIFIATYDADSPEVTGPLAGLVIGIDPGHQLKANPEHEPIAPGSRETKPKVSSGTSGVSTGTPEHEVNLEVALLLRDALEKKGAKVVMTRETADVDISNIERATLINEAGADLFLRLHCNGVSDRSANGAQMFVRKTGDKAEESYEAAKVILESMCSHTSARNRGVTRNDTYTGLNWSTVPSVLVEMGFMTNPTEDELLGDPEYQQKLADGMVEGIETYFANVGADTIRQP